MKTQSQRGVALVITLVMLAVVTFMAVVFLGISRRERSAVSVSADQTDARLMADAAANRAQAEIASRMLAQSNRFSYDLIVSTNFYSPYGLIESLPPGNPTNVNYEYTSENKPITANQWRLNLANLQYDASPPVYVVTNNQTGLGDLRFYLDLNRNGRFESNGVLPVINDRDMFLTPDGAERSRNLPRNQWRLLLQQHLAGDPEWVGVLDHPDRPHSSTNKFIGRYAYLVVPEGKTLDLNFMHNQAKRLGSGSDGFNRNQGVGPWELNLAAFLHDLNTNLYAWGGVNDQGYLYRTNLGSASSGSAFVDALALLTNRYDGNYGNLASARQVFGADGAAVLERNFADEYSNNDQANIADPLAPPAQRDDASNPWPGSDNLRRFTDVQELFDGKRSSKDFTNRLHQAGQNISTYDRYTYYRLLAQAGMDSTPAQTTKLLLSLPAFNTNVVILTNKLNINYDNRGAVDSTMLLTNDWTNIVFFTNAADRLLRATVSEPYLYTNASAAGRILTNYIQKLGETLVRTNFSLTNIQVLYFGPTIFNGRPYLYTNNEYTATTHRLLQVAANILDATTNRPFFASAKDDPYLPSVFRPILRRTDSNVIIVGYTQVLTTNEASLHTNYWVDIHDPSDRERRLPLVGVKQQAITELNAYGVPWVIGAKKGFPNFNEYSIQTYAQVGRKQEVIKVTPNGTDFLATNQMYLFSISNRFGIEAWNSYSNKAAYPRALEMRIQANYALLLTNIDPNAPSANRFGLQLKTNLNYETVLDANSWKGDSFRGILETNIFQSIGLPNSAFFFRPPNPTNQLVRITNNLPWLDPTPYHNPWFDTNRFLSWGDGWPEPTNIWMIVSNSVRYVLIDRESQKVVDLVNLTQLTYETNLYHVIVAGGSDPSAGTLPQRDRVERLFWEPNPNKGVMQMQASLGNIEIPDNLWRSALLQPVEGQDKKKAIDVFRIFMGLAPRFNPEANLQPQAALARASRVWQGPYGPPLKVVIRQAWQANDPLVHYTKEDLSDLQNFATTNGIPYRYVPLTDLSDMKTFVRPSSFPNRNVAVTNAVQELYPLRLTGEPLLWFQRKTEGTRELLPEPHPYGVPQARPLTRVQEIPSDSAWTFSNLGRINERYQPWDGKPDKERNTDTIYDLAVKDSLIKTSDDWEFPTNKFPNLGWLGRVHRGTPWQTIYLKAPVIHPIYWTMWAGSYGTHPVSDWHILELFTTANYDNQTRGLLSVNQGGLPAWSAALSGVTVLSNALSDTALADLLSKQIKPGYVPVVISPAGGTNLTTRLSTNVPLLKIVEGINRTRAALPGVDPHFPYLGSILATPELSLESPFLNRSTRDQVRYGISDAAYERIPQQILSLIREDQPRITVYAFGQSLKPADRSVIPSGEFRGLCTNYQVTGEMVSKTVLRLEGELNQNPRMVVESYKILPAE